MTIYQERFLLQDKYKTITTGLSPFLPSTRQTSLLLENKVGASGKGFQLTPKETGGDAAYFQYAQNYFDQVAGGRWPQLNNVIGKQTMKASQDMAQRLVRMLDYEGGDFGNPIHAPVEGEIRSKEIIYQMPKEIQQHFLNDPSLAAISKIGVSKTMDIMRDTEEGLVAMGLVSEMIGGKAGQTMRDNIAAMDVTDSKASKYFTGEFKNVSKVNKGDLAKFRDVILDKVQDLNDQFGDAGVGGIVIDATKSVQETFKGSIYEGKSTTKYSATSIEAFGILILANWIGLAHLYARDPSQTHKRDLFAFQEPIGESGYTAIISLRPDGRYGKDAPIRITADVHFRKVAPDGVVAGAGYLMAAAANHFARANNLNMTSFQHASDVAIASMAVQTEARVNAVHQLQNVAIGHMIDMSVMPQATVTQTMTTSDIASSLHAQIESWISHPDNRKKFERWYKRTWQQSERTYLSWRRQAISRFHQFNPGKGDAWEYREDQNPNPHAQEEVNEYNVADIFPDRPPGQRVETRKERDILFKVVPGDYGIWNPTNDPMMWKNMKEARGIQISPFLISRNKFVSRWGPKYGG